MKRPIVVLAVALPAVALAACGSSGSSSGGSGSGSRAATGGTPVLKAATKAHVGRVLVDARGRTLYRYTPDQPNRSVCMGSCLKLWPPATVKGSGPFTATGVKGRVGTTTRPDGAKQLTLNGMPLYRFVKDTSKADAKGQGFEHIWFVLPAKKASAGATGTKPAKQSGGYGY